MLNREQYLLIKLGEECNEVAQRVTKALTFSLAETQNGQPYDNAERIIQEFNDLLGVMDLLMEEGYFGIHEDKIFDPSAIGNKILKLEKYMEYSVKCGTLHPDAIKKVKV